jgi:DNA repair exonuclease SbcCD ATPase subunit
LNNNIYLEKIELSNFRVYGDSFILTLPPGPGITLISGPNGLGKTTLFNGVEWCLTGDVSGFEPYVGWRRRRQADHLTRFGAPEGSHRVSLYFSNSEPIDRGLGLAPDPNWISDFLKEAHWPEIGDLRLYLSITHFLGQSAAQRFSMKAPRDQWDALKGPAGVDRINHIKDAIGGQAARQAFTRAIRGATERLERTQEELRAWRELIEQRDRLLQLSVSAEGIAPAGILAASADLAREIVGIDPSAGWAPPAPSEAPETVLERLRALSAASMERLRAANVRLENLARVAAEFEAGRVRTKTSAEHEAEAESRRSVAAAEFASLNIKLSAALLELEAAQQRATEGNNRAQLLARLAAASAEYRSATERVAVLDKALAASDAAMKGIDPQRSKLSVEISEAVSRLEQRRELIDQADRARERLNLARRLRLAAEQARSLLARGDPRSAAEALRKERSGAVTQQRRVEAAIESIEVELRRMDERASAIVAAVAAIAAHLSPNDTECPVCRSRFREGELMALAQSADPGLAAGAQELGKNLSERQLEAADLRRRVAAIDMQLVDLDARVTSLNAVEAVIAELRRQLSDAGPIGEDGAVEDAARARLEELEAAIASLDREIEGAPSVDDLRGSLASVEAQARAETARRRSLVDSRAEVVAALDTARATLEQYPDLWSAVNGLSVDLDAARAEAASAAATAKSEADQRQAAVDHTRQQLQAAREKAATETATRDGLRQTQTDLTQRQRSLMNTWLATGMPGEPDSQALARERDRLAESASQLERIHAQLQRLVESYRQWLRDEDLADREKRVQQRLSEADISSEAELSAALRRKVAHGENYLARAQRTRERVEELVARLQHDANHYAEQVLRPLNETIQRFDRVLSTRADGSIFYRAEHHSSRSELISGIVRTQAPGDEVYMEMNPNLFFSEGQLSALSVSALLAASTTFKWSKWRALLMDDPLQHNDVIHASAFVDLLRQLVTRLGYQIILSTHDTTEATFLLRKCESAGVPFKLCELYPRGDEGLVSEAA